MAAPLELICDYLVVGAGATGMSFLEELVTSGPGLQVVMMIIMMIVMIEMIEMIMMMMMKVVIVDCRAAPGGHWNDAYSFVRLHQPSITYGVNSRTLGAGGPDLASKAQILQHYELVLQDLVSNCLL